MKETNTNANPPSTLAAGCASLMERWQEHYKELLAAKDRADQLRDYPAAMRYQAKLEIFVPCMNDLLWEMHNDELTQPPII